MWSQKMWSSPFKLYCLLYSLQGVNGGPFIIKLCVGMSLSLHMTNSLKHVKKEEEEDYDLGYF